ncbi:protein CYSTEINE-RICH TRANSMEMBRANE MODULE 11 isoform X2 [Rhododendron vialii]|uniref:protein CYSTEINE-RICH TRANSMEMBRANE MODULE 11 isoform X2 n=1 Tax=Rhododendron vialii TaxID=182163 RepID=UPI00265D7B52|nr:protein CYSTEINE-RICH TRANSMEMBRANE MODULE 11 isoform X2 [Rhododendron vialii]
MGFIRMIPHSLSSIPILSFQIFPLSLSEVLFFFFLIWVCIAEMSDPKYAYPYPAQGYYQGPPVMAPPQYAPPQYAPPPPQPPRRDTGFLEGCLAALCCCCLLDECCCDPSVFCVF